jgi:signal transduction histidine kinase
VTRRIVAAILLVTSISLTVFAVPLGLVIQKHYRDEALVELDRELTAATIEVPGDFGSRAAPIAFPADDIDYGVYLPSGRRHSGKGPIRGDSYVRRAARGEEVQGQAGGRLVAVVPLVSHEKVYGIVRGSRSDDELRERILRSWIEVAVLGIAIIDVVAILAVRLARRLDRPIEELVRVATELGDGDFGVRGERSGITELDRALDALSATARRLGAVLDRERAFSADASHQLRTPLTGLRVTLEELRRMSDPPPEQLDRAVAQVDRLERTIADLITLARDRAPVRAPLDLEATLAELDHAWGWQLDRLDRRLVLVRPDGLPEVRVSAAAVRQILDVLVSNAIDHGAGAVTITAREVADSLAIDVTDEGSGRIEDPDRLFVRRSADKTPDESGHGIGLALARTLAEAEGGRLLLRNPGPEPTFTLLFPSAEQA